MDAAGDYQYVEGGLSFVNALRFWEQLDEHDHAILIKPGSAGVAAGEREQFPFRENCDYNDQGFVCTVPPGNYFMMGDNRDSSATAATGDSCPSRTSSARRS